MSIRCQESYRCSKESFASMICRFVNNKASLISDAIVVNNFDCVARTETWLDHEEDKKAVISSLVPSGCDILHVPRTLRGKGAGFIHKTQLLVELKNTLEFSSLNK